MYFVCSKRVYSLIPQVFLPSCMRNIGRDIIAQLQNAPESTTIMSTMPTPAPTPEVVSNTAPQLLRPFVYIYVYATVLFLWVTQAVIPTIIFQMAQHIAVKIIVRVTIKLSEIGRRCRYERLSREYRQLYKRIHRKGIRFLPRPLPRLPEALTALTEIAAKVITACIAITSLVVPWFIKNWLIGFATEFMDKLTLVLKPSHSENSVVRRNQRQQQPYLVRLMSEFCTKCVRTAIIVLNVSTNFSTSTEP